MCGILCGATHHYSVLAALPEALETLAHRGPDTRHFIQKGNIFLGHARLAIVGVSDGQQPLSNENGSIYASVNGEFYDFQSIRKHLQDNGHSFRTQSDSEILIHLYEEYGVDCLKHLHGEFAFALYDQNKKLWFCARDRSGTRPLQFVHQPGLFLIASEAKALFAAGVPAKLDRESFWFAQHLQYLPQGTTLFEGVQMIRPAHYLLVDENGARQHSYWNLNCISEIPCSFEAACEQAGALLSQSVARRIPGEVPWACHLSGGLDSSIINALSRSYPGAGHCFTVRFTDDGFYDESAFAEETAQFLDSTLHIVPASFLDMLNVLPQSIFHAEGLSINGHLGAKYLLNQAIHAESFKVTLSGEGADELFMGYSHLKQDYLSPSGVSLMEKQYLAGIQLPSGETLDLSHVKDQLGFVPTWLMAKSSMAYRLKSLWASDFHFDSNPYSRFLSDSGIPLHPTSSLKNSSSLWIQYCLSGYILKVLDDAQSMAHGVEGRLPFLDTDLMEFMWSLPDSLYFHQGIEKGILRTAFAGALPPSVLAKTKQSFMSPPIQRGLKQPLCKSKIYSWLLDNPHFSQQNLFNSTAIEKFLSACENTHTPTNEPILMTLISSALLCEQFKL